MTLRTTTTPAATFLLVWTCAACSSPPPQAEPDDGADAALAKAVEWYSPTIRSWVTGCGTGEDLWRFRLSTTVQCDDRGTPLTGSGGTFEWPVDLEASVIDGLIVDGERLDEIELRLHWTASDSFTDERSATPEGSVSPEGGMSGSRNVFFDLRSEPEWQGQIRRLRLVWASDTSSSSRLHGVRVGGAG